jgi:hypothetical protein
MVNPFTYARMYAYFVLKSYDKKLKILFIEQKDSQACLTFQKRQCHLIKQ